MRYSFEIVNVERFVSRTTKSSRMADQLTGRRVLTVMVWMLVGMNCRCVSALELCCRLAPFFDALSPVPFRR